MKCPYCERTMKRGYMIDRSQPIQWIPEDSKPSIWKTGVAEGAVVLGDGGFWQTYKATAYYCPSCKMVIAPVSES